MLATLAEAPLEDAALIYEPKYDGIRALVSIDPPPRARRGARTTATADAGVSIWSRLGNQKNAQFPDLVRELERFARTLDAPVVLDGEIVALGPDGSALGFQQLQGRIHLTGESAVARSAEQHPIAFIAFDILRDGDEDLRGRPLTERRARLEQRFGDAGSHALRLSPSQRGSGKAFMKRARDEGWEGLIAKHATSPYESGRRSPSWRKVKLVLRQEFVVGGWTDPRDSRQHFGALLLGVYEGHALRLAGQVGSGFTGPELDRIAKLLRARQIDTCPFLPRPHAPSAHWVEPTLVAEVKFTEWTADNVLRHPVYIGLRDDRNPRTIVREQANPRLLSTSVQAAPRTVASAKIQATTTIPAIAPTRGSAATRPARIQRSRTREGFNAAHEARHRPALKIAARERGDIDAVIGQLDALEKSRKDGVVHLPGGQRLDVTNLWKVFWPASKLTKGDLMRYYVRASPYLLPVVSDRVLVMKRFPNGIEGPAFYQQRQRMAAPPGVRVEVLPDELEPIGESGVQRFVGGSLLTLLYMTQLAAISQDPWFSRVTTPLEPDQMAIDLDPGDHTTFATVLDVARWTRDVLDTLGIPGVPKTSGSSGLHIYIPLPPHTTWETGLLLTQIVATMVADKHRKAATVVRQVRQRPRGTVYVDYLQNILGKTIATAYSARASAFAGVSTPLTWREVDEGVDPGDFTIKTAPSRFEAVGDLWGRLRTGKPADLHALVAGR